MAGAPILEARDFVVVRNGKELVRVERFAVQPGEVHVPVSYTHLTLPTIYSV